MWEYECWSEWGWRVNESWYVEVPLCSVLIFYVSLSHSWYFVTSKVYSTRNFAEQLWIDASVVATFCGKWETYCILSLTTRFWLLFCTVCNTTGRSLGIMRLHFLTAPGKNWHRKGVMNRYSRPVCACLWLMCHSVFRNRRKVQRREIHVTENCVADVYDILGVKAVKRRVAHTGHTYLLITLYVSKSSSWQQQPAV